jgi:hypothetical protein
MLLIKRIKPLIAETDYNTPLDFYLPPRRKAKIADYQHIKAQRLDLVYY